MFVILLPVPSASIVLFVKVIVASAVTTSVPISIASALTTILPAVPIALIVLPDFVSPVPAVI